MSVKAERYRVTADRAKILLIENEEGFARKIRTMLEERGHQAVVASESRLALRLFLRHPSRFDLVVLDDNMPRVMGVPLAEGIMRVRPDVTIVILRDAARTVSATNGLFVVASKEMRLEEFVSAICQLLPDKR
jgi:DNA-binding response OmpR family regulator